MRKIGTRKLGSHITNSRPRMTLKQGIGTLKKANFQSHVREIADKKTVYKVRMYCNLM